MTEDADSPQADRMTRDTIRDAVDAIDAMPYRSDAEVNPPAHLVVGWTEAHEHIPPPQGMNTMIEVHFGRSFPGTGNPIELTCPCPKAPCGLVSTHNVSPNCYEHGLGFGKTIRQSHPAQHCAAARATTLDRFGRL